MSAGSPKFTVRRIAALSLVSLWLAGCSDTSNPPAPVSSVNGNAPANTNSGMLITPPPKMGTTSTAQQPQIQPVQQPHFPLLNYSRNSYMGRLINRTLTRHSELSFSTFFVSSMSELLKQVALDGCGIAWLPEYAIQQEIRSGKLVVLNRDELVIPIQAYAYRMNTRMNPVAERFWRELRELEIVLS